jgi:hypothetical protein
MAPQYRRPFLAAAVVSLSLIANSALAAYVGGNSYQSFANSPFSGLSFGGYFHLENFEDQSLNTPGVTQSGGTITSGGFSGTIIDSVDADDGAVNGSCNKGAAAFVACDSFFGSGATGISFTFGAGVLGTLPTHVGIVWTDGVNSVNLEAFDAMGASLGVFGPFNVAGGGFADQDVAEDTFVGVIEPGGISRILITSGAGGGIEVDHLQYGADATSTVPEPTPLALLMLALICMLLLVQGGRIRQS